MFDLSFNFRETLEKAKIGEKAATLSIIEQFTPLIDNMSLDNNGKWDEDLHQEILETVLRCIHIFQILE